MKTTIEYIWVKNTYSGDQAKHVKSLSSVGVGYYILGETSSRANPEVIAAFRVSSSNMPKDIEVCDRYEVERLESKLNKRNGGLYSPTENRKQNDGLIDEKHIHISWTDTDGKKHSKQYGKYADIAKAHKARQWLIENGATDVNVRFK